MPEVQQLHASRAARLDYVMASVELYLRRPTAGLPPYPVSDKVLLHAATGQPIPLN